jgi:hypothetical protein
MSTYLLVLTRDEQVRSLSAAALGALTGRATGWVSLLRRWRLLRAVAVGDSRGPVRGCLLVTATDLAAARRMAASCPTPVTVLALVGEAP